MKLNGKTRNVAGLLVFLGTFCGAAFAGRPLVVDDANVNEAGHAQLEAWAAHGSGTSVYNLAPAYSPIDGLEIGALLARDTGASTSPVALQAKWRFTPARDDGCNAAAVLGAAHVAHAPSTRYLNGLVTCNHTAAGTVHMNLDVSQSRHSSGKLGWGIAYEKKIMGVTPNVEWFGAEHSKPTMQLGLRGNVAANLQLDGSVGRTDRRTLYTLGTKLQF